MGKIKLELTKIEAQRTASAVLFYATYGNQAGLWARNNGTRRSCVGIIKKIENEQRKEATNVTKTNI